MYGTLLLALCVSVAQAQQAQAPSSTSSVKHVILISVDGMHELDLSRYLQEHSDSTLAGLAHSGTLYSNAYLPGPSDSFPGIIALTTGASPEVAGVYYDDSFSRTLYPPGSCPDGASLPNVTAGAEILYDESVDINNTMISGGGEPGFDASSIDMNQLPLDANCTPVPSWSFLQATTIFEVAKQSGLRTAWSDKHPAYTMLNGPSGTGLDDLYTPEINCNCADEDGQPTLVDGSGDDYTKNYNITHIYDNLHVQAVINQIHGRDSKNLSAAPVPTIFGCNFQTLSVAQKYAGYTDGQATPTQGVADALDYVDSALGEIVSALQEAGLTDSSALIITAKHGQAPINPKLAKLVEPSLLTDALTAAAVDVAQATQDDVALLWLTNPEQVEKAIDALIPLQSVPDSQNGSLGIQSVGTAYDYGVQSNVLGRQPDVVVQTQPGVIYSKTSGTKIAEHGGLSDDDMHVGLLVSVPGSSATTIDDPVKIVQVAPTILHLLGLDETKLSMQPGVLPAIPYAQAPPAATSAAG